ncbi:MAG: transcriptional regulator [Pseudohongiellaceae bacterium]
MTETATARKLNSALLAIKTISGGSTGEGVNRLIYERLRLAIVSALAVQDALSFSELKSLLDTTDGNLSMHARKLEEAKLIRCKKTFSERTPRTEYSLTPKGRKALEVYLTHMENLVNSMKEPPRI